MSTTVTEHDRDIDRRVGILEGISQQLDKRFDGLDKQIASMNQTMTAGFAELRQAISDTNRRIDKLIFGLTASVLTIVGLLIGLLIKL